MAAEGIMQIALLSGEYGRSREGFVVTASRTLEALTKDSKPEGVDAKSGFGPVVVMYGFYNRLKLLIPTDKPDFTLHIKSLMHNLSGLKHMSMLSE